MLGKISTAFTYPFYKCALLYHNPVSLCVNGCQGLSHTKCLSVSASQPTSEKPRELSHASQTENDVYFSITPYFTLEGKICALKPAQHFLTFFVLTEHDCVCVGVVQPALRRVSLKAIFSKFERHCYV